MKTEKQQAFVATIRVLVPCRDNHGTAVESVSHAQDYISETLRGEFLDWGYVEQPKEITVRKPYIEGSMDWSIPPVHCPRCGGTNITTCMIHWDAQSKNEQDSGNTAVLDEHQCMDCEGASFWT